MTTFVVESLDDQANGIFHCYSDGSVYQTYKIPRHLIDNASSLEYLDHPGVYLLFGENIEANYVGDVYVMSTNLRRGEEDTISRILEDQKNINWKDVVVFTTENNTWGATELMYLEYAFYNIAKESKRYNVVNGSSPVSVPMTKRTKDAMDKFIIWAENILGMFGYKYSEPYNVSSTSYSEPNEPKQTDSEVMSNGPTDDEDIHKHSKPHNPIIPERDDSNISYPLPLHMTYYNAYANGLYDGKNLTVLSGSTIHPKTSKSCPSKVKAIRNLYLIDKNTNVTTQDHIFESPTAATEFIGGCSLNGYDYWYNDDGVSLNGLITIGKKERIKPDSIANTPFTEEEPPSNTSKHILLYMTCKDAHATGWYDGNSFTVCKGSVISSIKAPSCQDDIEKNRRKYSNLIDQNYMLKEDITFRTPSGAAGFVAYHNMSGNTYWRDKRGISLGELLAKKKITKPTTQITQSGQSQNNAPSEFEPVIVYMSTRGAAAFGMYDGRQFMLCKDSVLCSEKSASCSQSIIQLREKYADKIDQSNILTEDITFKKPSQAAAFVALKSENGYECWHDSYGNSLNKIMNRSPKRKS